MGIEKNELLAKYAILHKALIRIATLRDKKKERAVFNRLWGDMEDIANRALKRVAK